MGNNYFFVFSFGFFYFKTYTQINNSNKKRLGILNTCLQGLCYGFPSLLECTLDSHHEVNLRLPNFWKGRASFSEENTINPQNIFFIFFIWLASARLHVTTECVRLFFSSAVKLS